MTQSSRTEFGFQYHDGSYWTGDATMPTPHFADAKFVGTADYAQLETDKTLGRVIEVYVTRKQTE